MKNVDLDTKETNVLIVAIVTHLQYYPKMMECGLFYMARRQTYPKIIIKDLGVLYMGLQFIAILVRRIKDVSGYVSS